MFSDRTSELGGMKKRPTRSAVPRKRWQAVGLVLLCVLFFRAPNFRERDAPSSESPTDDEVGTSTVPTDETAGRGPAVNFKKGDKLLWYQKLPLPMLEGAPADQKVCFVHVGKTAGSTLACYLGFHYDCGQQFTIPNGRLPRYTTNLMHTVFNDCKKDHFEFYLFTTRNPLSRIVSWFQYEKVNKSHEGHAFYKQKAPLFMECYATILELAEKGLGRKGKKESKCQKRARMAIEGSHGYAVHNKYNLGLYLSQTPPQGRIVVIRTEYLVDDWNSVEATLGGSDQFPGDTFARKNRSSRREDPLSQLAIANLCEALCDEFQTYKKILRRAENLSEEQRAISIAEIHESCPMETKKLRSCK
jgi:hypothetical protein